jgi:hypothetical protein
VIKDCFDEELHVVSTSDVYRVSDGWIRMASYQRYEKLFDDYFPGSGDDSSDGESSIGDSVDVLSDSSASEGENDNNGFLMIVMMRVTENPMMEMTPWRAPLLTER